MIGSNIRHTETVWEEDLWIILSLSLSDREIQGQEGQRDRRETDNGKNLESGLCLRKPVTPVFTDNSSQQKDLCGMERSRLKFKTASREDGFLDKVVNQRTCLRLFIMIS